VYHAGGFDAVGGKDIPGETDAVRVLARVDPLRVGLGHAAAFRLVQVASTNKKRAAKKTQGEQMNV
jgi:hypothetical protein